MVKVSYKLSPYGLSDKEWRAYLLYFVNKDPQKSTLAEVARKLMKELEPKISEIELTIDREKEPLSAKATKNAKLYLTKVKQDRLKIKFLVDCFPAYFAKRSRDKSATSDSGNGIKRQD